MPAEVSIPSHEFEIILNTMTTALYFSQNADLADSYRTLEADPVWSPLTEQLVVAVTILQSFIPEEEIDFPQTEEEFQAAMKDESDVPTPEQ